MLHLFGEIRKIVTDKDLCGIPLMDTEPVSLYKEREEGHFFPPPNGGQGALAIVESQLVGANVVVAARQFNPTIFTQLWLVDHGIATREDFVGGNSLFSRLRLCSFGPRPMFCL